MDSKKCKDCAHFYQHYGIDHQKIYRVFCGHCAQGRVRKRNPDAAACEMFVPGEADACAFVTKEYLSRALLEHVLSLELLPEIQDMPNQSAKNRPLKK